MRAATDGSSERGIWALAWPTIAANLLRSLVSVVDTQAVAVLGAAAMAAATGASRFFLIQQGTLFLVMAGTTAYVARFWGAGDRDSAEKTLSTALVLGVMQGGVLAAVGIVGARTFARYFGFDGATLETATSFGRWLSLFFPAHAILFVVTAALRAVGEVKLTLWIGGIGNVLNAILLWIFMYGGLGFTPIGARGAPMAGGCATTVVAGAVTLLWLRGRLPLKPRMRDGYSAEAAKSLLRIGVPALFEQLVLATGMTLSTGIVAWYGESALAAWGIGMQLLVLSFMVGFGFESAAAILVGQALGAGHPRHAVRSTWRAMRSSASALAVLGLAAFLCADRLGVLMIEDASAAAGTAGFLRITAVGLPLLGIEYTLSGALRGAGDTRFKFIASVVGLLTRVAAGGVLAYVRAPVSWIYATILVDSMTKVCLLVVRFRSNKWQTVIAATPVPSMPPAAVTAQVRA